jgi:hypothetical protein
VDAEGLKDGQKALRMTGRLEALQYPLSPPGPLVRVLGAVVQVAALPMFGIGQQVFKCSPIAA